MRITKLIILLVFTTAAWGQDLPSIQLRDVIVEGHNRSSEAVIRATTQMHAGSSVTVMDIQRGIRRLWELGFFADIQFYLEDRIDEEVTLRITVKEYSSVEEIVFEGNKKIGKKKLMEIVELRPPQIMSEYAVSEAVRAIKKLYHEDGYLNVEVTTFETPGNHPHGRVLHISVVEHKKVRMRGVRFVGNEEFSSFTLRRKMKNVKQWRWYLFWRSAFDRDKLEEDLTAIVTHYRNHGFRDARILSDTVQVAPNGKRLELIIEIFEGHPYYYRDFSWEGNTLHSDRELAAALGFKKGDRYHQEAFEMAVARRVQPIYMNEGYLYSRVEPVEYPVGKDSLDVVFNIVENHKVAVRFINVTGNDKTRDYVIRRELRINPGETFSYAKLERSQRDVWILNFFENVVPDVLPVDEDEVDLNFTVTERSTDRANLSVGYTEQFGIIGGGGLEFNNLLGTGQQLNLSYSRGAQSIGSFNVASQGGSFQSGSVSLLNPWVFNTPNLVGISAFYTERGQGALYLPLDIVQRGGSIRWGRRFRWPDSFFRGSWIFQGSEKRYSGEAELLRTYLAGVRDEDIDSKGGRDFVTTVGVSFTQSITRDSRDRPEFPTTGSEFSWVSTVSGLFLGGNEDFHKHVFTMKWYAPIINKLVFHQLFKLGAIKQIRNPTSRSILPPEEKFYLGGTGIPFGELLRGYPDNTVGPYSSRPLGATVMLKYSAEIRFSLSQNPTIYTLVFMDMGNSWADFSQVDPFDLKRSLGVGVRMFMPLLGLLGLDAGYGFDSIQGDTSGPGWEVHFIFGRPI